MNSVGAVLRNAREKKGLSLSEIEEETKIKSKFLTALEEGSWKVLPGFSTTCGFVKTYAKNVGVDPDYAAALLRRDFPQARSHLRNETDIRFSTVWTPRATITAVILLALLIVGAYLIRQYMVFAAPPPLTVQTFREGEQIIVSGKTRSTATLEVEGRNALLFEDGSFKVTLDVSSLGDFLELKAISRSGKETVYKEKVDSL